MFSLQKVTDFFMQDVLTCLVLTRSYGVRPQRGEVCTIPLAENVVTLNDVDLSSRVLKRAPQEFEAQPARSAQIWDEWVRNLKKRWPWHQT